MNDIIEMMELYATIHDVPIMEKEGIQWLQTIIKQHNIKSILEIGSAIGYSAIQMARLDPAIHITTIEKDEKRYLLAVDNIKACKLDHQIDIILGDGLDYKPNQHFDMVFIDAAKAKYELFFERFSSYCKPQGIIVSDNMKFHGLVEHPENIKTRGTRKLVEKLSQYQQYLRQHAFYDTEFIEVGDGIALCRRRQHFNIDDIDAVLFDMDGTMLDSEQLYIRTSISWNEKREQPLLFDDAFFHSVIGKTDAASASIFNEHFGTQVSYTTYIKEIHELVQMAFETKGIPLKPHLIELLSYLKLHNKKLAVATSTTYDKAVHLLQKAGIYEYFDVVVGGDMVAYSKPHPAIFQEAAKRLNVSASRTLVLEDSNAGVESGARGGFGTIMVVDLVAPTDQSKDIAFAVYENLQRVHQLLSDNKK